MANFFGTIHLLGRYPELAHYPEFQTWLRAYGGEIWHETSPDEKGYVTVTVQSDNRLNLFSALLLRDTSRFAEGMVENQIIRAENIDVVDQEVSLANAVRLTRAETGASNRQIHAIRPVVDFQSDQPQLIWEVEIRNADSMTTFNVFNMENAVRVDERAINRAEEVLAANPLPTDTNDWLAENECHHLSTWRSWAQTIVGAATTPSEKANRICITINQKMRFDANITNIRQFTWSDNLIIQENHLAGVCDEWAVIQTTLLRALGIPAGIKFLFWPGNSHACVEWSDNGVWRHMDALWGAFDYRQIYRERLGASVPVTVMDVGSPIDSRSSNSCYGVPDVVGDEKFCPYGDFAQGPVERRPGYSY